MMTRATYQLLGWLRVVRSWSGSTTTVFRVSYNNKVSAQALIVIQLAPPLVPPYQALSTWYSPRSPWGMEAKGKARSMVVSVYWLDWILSSWTWLVGESSQMHGRVEGVIDMDSFCCSQLSSGRPCLAKSHVTERCPPHPTTLCIAKCTKHTKPLLLYSKLVIQ